MIVGFDSILDDPSTWEDLGALAEKGLLLAAYGHLADNAPPVNPLFRRPR